MQINLEKFLASEVPDLSAKKEPVDVKAGLRRIDLTVKKMSEKAPTLEAKIPISSLCTSACFSSVSSFTNYINPEGEGEAEKVEALVNLHDKALAVMGQDKLVDAAIAKCVELELNKG